jgi:hypothetical protein
MNAYCILLNNMAVSMLQRSCHGQGFETLKDAIKINQSLMRKEEEEQPPGHHQQLLTKALHRASNPLINPSCVQVDTLSHNDADFCGLRDILAPSSNNNKTSPMMLIRIDTSDEDVLQDDGHSLMLSILLLNAGVAASLGAHQRNGFAANLLACSMSLLHILFDDTKEDPFALKRVVFIFCIVLEALIPLLSEQQEQASWRRQQLDHLYKVATSLDCSGLFRDYIAPAAAAA